MPTTAIIVIVMIAINGITDLEVSSFGDSEVVFEAVARSSGISTLGLEAPSVSVIGTEAFSPKSKVDGVAVNL